jgi:hypothetical protein
MAVATEATSDSDSEYDGDDAGSLRMPAPSSRPVRARKQTNFYGMVNEGDIGAEGMAADLELEPEAWLTPRVRPHPSWSAENPCSLRLPLPAATLTLTVTRHSSSSSFAASSELCCTLRCPLAPTALTPPSAWHVR